MIVRSLYVWMCFLLLYSYDGYILFNITNIVAFHLQSPIRNLSLLDSFLLLVVVLAFYFLFVEHFAQNHQKQQNQSNYS